jgi:hypothetical protein
MQDCFKDSYPDITKQEVKHEAISQRVRAHPEKPAIDRFLSRWGEIRVETMPVFSLCHAVRLQYEIRKCM